MITIKIDVTKIDKSKLFKGKNGAMYLDAVLIDTPDNQYGSSHMIVQSVSKEEREQGIKGEILGNAKTFDFGNNSSTKTVEQDIPSDDLPF